MSILKPITIDLSARPHLQFRIDAFAVPAPARSEFEAAMRRNLAFISTLPGFLNHLVFEKTSGPTTFEIVTIAVWESAEVIAQAAEKVRAYYQNLGSDMPTMVARLGIIARVLPCSFGAAVGAPPAPVRAERRAPNPGAAIRALLAG